jgi:hypothetical protein
MLVGYGHLGLAIDMQGCIKVYAVLVCYFSCIQQKIELGQDLLKVGAIEFPQERIETLVLEPRLLIRIIQIGLARLTITPLDPKLASQLLNSRNIHSHDYMFSDYLPLDSAPPSVEFKTEASEISVAETKSPIADYLPSQGFPQVFPVRFERGITKARSSTTTLTDLAFRPYIKASAPEIPWPQPRLRYLRIPCKPTPAGWRRLNRKTTALNPPPSLGAHPAAWRWRDPLLARNSSPAGAHSITATIKLF